MQANLAFIWCFWVHKTHNSETQYLKKFDRDSNLNICLLPGLEAQKVENHWTKTLKQREGNVKTVRERERQRG